MHIAVVTETYWPEINGVAMTLHRLVTGLAALGHKIQLICPHLADRSVDDLQENIQYHLVRGFPMPGYRDVTVGFPSRKHLKNLWRYNRPDVIYVATEGPLGLSAAKEANRQGIPVTSGFHTNFHSYSRHYRLGKLENLVAKYLVSMHNRTLTTIVPTVEQKAMIETMGIKHVSVMGRGVDTALFSPEQRSGELRKQWGISGTEPVMLYVGRIAEEKNLGLTIDAYHQMHELNNKLKFVLVGDGPMMKKLQKDYPDFIFTGRKTGQELAVHYASGDIFLFTSLTETFGNVILEAMASGLGIVAFDYAAAHLHIDPEENGLLAPTTGADSFIDQSKRLVENEILLKKIRLNAAKYAQQYSWSAIVAQFENILTTYLDNDSLDWKEEYESVQQSN